MAAAKSAVALTGATGFVGRAVCAALAAREVPVRALVRSTAIGTDLGPGVGAIQGSLDDAASLEPLVEGAGAVIHLAGIVSARKTPDYHRVNADGTARLVAAVERMARPARFLLVSSLAARSPGTSPYAASKRAGEDIATASGLEVCVVRPPAVYGPGDRGTLPIFQQLARGFLLAPRAPGARFSLIYVDDLADLLCRLLTRPGWQRAPVEPDDGRHGGYGWSELAELAAPVVGRHIRPIGVPRSLMWCAAALDETAAAVRGRAPTLSRGKLGELWYPDWVCRDRPAEDVAGWQPRIDFAEGASRALAWYRRHGWL